MTTGHEDVGKASTRTVELEFEINAPAEAVWKALTEAEEITQWFSPQAKVKPGVGGSIRWTWNEVSDWGSRIEIWEPQRHLRAVYDRSPTLPDSCASPIPMAMDFYLETRGGKTVLHLVHSGFGRVADWDEEYDGVCRGWNYELRSLRHYLEHHPGRPRAMAWAGVATSLPYEEAWKRLMGNEGLQCQDALRGLGEGDSYSITAITGDTFRGKVLVSSPPREFGGTVENLNNALLRVAVERCGQQLEAWVWLSAWRLPQAEVDAFRHRWTALLEGLFPEIRRN